MKNLEKSQKPKDSEDLFRIEQRLKALENQPRGFPQVLREREQVPQPVYLLQNEAVRGFGRRRGKMSGDEEIEGVDGVRGDEVKKTGGNGELVEKMKDEIYRGIRQELQEEFDQKFSKAQEAEQLRRQNLQNQIQQQEETFRKKLEEQEEVQRKLKEQKEQEEQIKKRKEQEQRSRMSTKQKQYGKDVGETELREDKKKCNDLNRRISQQDQAPSQSDLQEQHRIEQQQRIDQERVKIEEQRRKFSAERRKDRKDRTEMRKLGVDLEEVREGDKRVLGKVERCLGEENYQRAMIEVVYEGRSEDSLVEIEPGVLDYGLKSVSEVPEEVKKYIRDNPNKLLTTLSDLPNEPSSITDHLLQAYLRALHIN